MKGEGFTLKRRGQWGTADAAGSGALYSAVIELLDHGPPGAAATVRPVVMDSIFDWMPPIEAALPDEPGARIGVTGSDALLAARVACDAAGWIAERGKRVVLIDGSIESPVVLKALPEDGDEGLVDVLLFGVSPSVAVRRTLAPGVFLVTAGSHAMSPSGVVFSEAFRNVVSDLSADAVVMVVLPSGLLPFALAGLSSVLAVERTAEDLSSIATFLSEIEPPARPSAVGVLVGEPERDVAQAHERLEEALPPREGDEHGVPLAEEIARPPADLGGPPDHAEVVPAPTAAEPPLDATGFAPSPDGAPREIILGSGEDGRPRRRRGPIALLALLVVVLAAVGVWRVTETREPPPDETGRGTSAEPARPTRKPPAPGEGEQGLAPGRAEEQAWPGESGGETGQEESGEAPTTAATEGGDAGAGQKMIAGTGGPYIVFLSSHRIESAAREDAQAALSRGVESEIVPTEVGDTGRWYRVVVRGGSATLGEARSVLDAVKALGYDGAWIERSQEGR